jgi:steroid 5-alpha reductase family enzyme
MLSDFWSVLFLVGVIAASIAYVIARRMGLMAVVDTVWSSGVGLASLAYLYAHELYTPQAYLVALVITFWSLRLTYHLLRDRVLRGEEDPRYANLAQHWGQRAARNFYLLFLAQIPFIALFAFPVTIALRGGALGWWDGLGVAIALLALFGESLADRQLARFRADPANRGGVCQQGLWQYSRHPNYFFEWLHWWAYVCFAIGSAGWTLTLLGPAAMYLFLRFLTGVPHAERSSLAHRGEAYRAYQQTTNAFFPWIPHHKKN